MKALVLGLGNRNLGDDGLGSCLASVLAKRAKGIDVEDGDDMGLGLVGWLEGYDLAILVDVAEDEEEEANAYLIEAEKASYEELKDMITDSHKASPVQIALLARASGIFKGKAYFVSIKPERLCFMCPPSEEGIKRALKAANLINKILEVHGLPKIDVEGLEKDILEECKKL